VPKQAHGLYHIEKGFWRGIMEIDEYLYKLDPITIQELDDMKLLKRFDTKFVVPNEYLVPLLQHLSKEYRILDIDGMRSFTYESLYLDTPDHKFFLQHHNKKLNRYKVRLRDYVEAGKQYLEVKFKTNKDKLKKYRMKISGIENGITPEMLEFLDDRVHGVDAASMEPVIWTNYKRFSLAHRTELEKITVDMDVTFLSHDRSVEKKLNAVIVEIKQAHRSLKSPFIRMLKEVFYLTPSSFSKYCIGMIYLGHPVKYNRFKPRLLQLVRLSGAGARVGIKPGE